MVFHGPISKHEAHSIAWRAVQPSRALSHHKIPYVLWGDFFWAAFFRVPTACLDTVYFVVPSDCVDAAVKAISAALPFYKRSSKTQLVLPNSSYPAEFPDIPVLEYEPFCIGIIPADLVAFNPTDTARTTTMGNFNDISISVPTLPGLLDSCADVFRIHSPQQPQSGAMDRMADAQREYERKLALLRFARLAETYTLLYCFRKKERGPRWKSIEELPEKHHRIAKSMRPENGQRFLNEFVDSGEFQYLEDSDEEEDSGWEDDEDGDLDAYDISSIPILA